MDFELEISQAEKSIQNVEELKKETNYKKKIVNLKRTTSLLRKELSED